MEHAAPGGFHRPLTIQDLPWNELCLFGLVQLGIAVGRVELSQAGGFGWVIGQGTGVGREGGRGLGKEGREGWVHKCCRVPLPF